MAWAEGLIGRRESTAYDQVVRKVALALSSQSVGPGSSCTSSRLI